MNVYDKVVLLILQLPQLIYCQDWHFQGPNVALNKPANQSSTYEGFDAVRAVDGSKNGILDNFGSSCSHTNSPGGSWWRVDLYQNFMIKGIQIYNRIELKDRLQNFTVSGLTDGGDGVQLYDDKTMRLYQNTVINITVNSKSPFRYILISIPRRPNDHSYLALCEVEIYAVLCSFPTAIPPLLDRLIPDKGSVVDPSLGATHGAMTHDRYVTQGAQIEFSCQRGYQIALYERTTLTCQDDEVYYTYPKCGKITPCQLHPLTLYHHVQYKNSTMSEYYPGESVSWNCETGYSPQTIQQLTCQWYHIRNYYYESRWSTPWPSCLPVCSYPGRLEHGFYTDHLGRHYTSGSVEVGTSVSVSCLYGYKPSKTTIRCTQSSHSTVWDKIAYCMVITCRALDDREMNGGKYRYNTTAMTSQEYVFGTSARATCLSNFTFSGEETLRTCGSLGNWSGTPGVCAPACEVPKTPNGIYRDEKGGHMGWYMSGQSVQLQCHKGFEISNAVRSSATISMTCLANHSWGGEQLTCTEQLGPSTGSQHMNEQNIQHEEEKQTMPIAVIVGTGVGGVVLGAALVAVVVCVYIRRVKHKQNDTQEEAQHTQAASQPAAIDLHEVYSYVNTSLTVPMENLYEQPTKPDPSEQHMYTGLQDVHYENDEPTTSEKK